MAETNGPTEKVKGPASYFPSIEAKHGGTIAEWKQRMRATGLTTHKELVAWLKDEHGFGHGHAGAITHHLLHEGTERGSTDELVDALFPAKKAHWRATYDRLAGAATAHPDVQVLPKKALVGFGTRAQFLMLQPSTADRFDVGLKLPDEAPTDRLEVAGSWNAMMTHRVRITDADQVDEELLAWIEQAYQRSLAR